jgi:hypothetical protein
MSAVCRHHIIKPFAGGVGRPRGFQEGIGFSEGGKEYCTHSNSLHLPGTPVGVTCGGDVTKCEIPKAKR